MPKKARKSRRNTFDRVRQTGQPLPQEHSADMRLARWKTPM
jgi:hypothetical protein